MDLERTPPWTWSKSYIDKTKGGYAFVYMPVHPRSDCAGRVREHMLVMENKLGRLLEKNENVHHKNGNRADNRPSNLELFVKSQPSGQRPEDLVEWVINHYPEIVAKKILTTPLYPLKWLSQKVTRMLIGIAMKWLILPLMAAHLKIGKS